MDDIVAHFGSCKLYDVDKKIMDDLNEFADVYVNGHDIDFTVMADEPIMQLLNTEMIEYVQTHGEDILIETISNKIGSVHIDKVFVSSIIDYYVTFLYKCFHNSVYGGMGDDYDYNHL